MNQNDVVLWSLRILAIGCCIQGLEILAKRQLLAEGGAFDWHLLRTSSKLTMQGWASRVAEVLMSYHACILWASLLVGGGLYVLLANDLRFFVIPVAALFISKLMLHLRYQSGLDGADQMSTIVIAGNLAFLLSPFTWAKGAALIFIAAQAILSYETAGIVKIASSMWRNGSAIRGIARTETYGSTLLRRAVRHRWISFTICWATIIFEVGMPNLVWAGMMGCLLFIVVGSIFHASIALTMGLNNFVWAFLATYPALLWVSTLLPAG